MNTSLDSAGKPEPNVFDTQLEFLSRQWDLGLKASKQYLPIKATEKEAIVRKLSYCYYKHVYNAAIEEFNFEASKLYTKWLKSPVSVRGPITQKTRDRPKPISSSERDELLRLLRSILDRYIEACPKTPRKPPKEASKAIQAVLIPSSRGPGSKSSKIETMAQGSGAAAKRSFEGLNFTPTKKIKAPAVSQSTLKPSVKASPQTIAKAQGLKQTTVESFVSASTVSASSFNISKASTQITIPDQNEINKSTSSTIPDSQPQYWSSSLEESFNVLDKQLQSFDSAASASSSIRELVSDEQVLRDQLQTLFPELPKSLYSAPFCVSFEITRVFSHAQVSMSGLKKPTISFNDYDKFWQYLKSLPALQGKQLPERSSRDAWACAIDPSARDSQQFESVVFSASLSFNSNTSEELFKLRLMPLRIALPHRSGRQFGHDRFLELRVPNLESAPCYKKDVIPDLLLKAGPSAIYDWLVNSSHHFLGRKWVPFSVKPVERSKNAKTKVDKSSGVGHVLYLFSVSGCTGGNYKGHPNMTVGKLLDAIRPTGLNGEQSYLKLFARSSLALSRNRPTVVVPESQIRFHTKDILSGTEVMNDGAARLSRSLGEKISRILGLSYHPAAFQGRFGGAKGLWVVDHVDETKEDWIEVYPSQQKWNRDTRNDDVHRTFEVLAYSSRLKTHALNEQLVTLLMEGAKDKNKMKKSMSAAMETSLDLKLAEIDLALDNPQLLREWIRRSNPNTKERLNAGGISYEVAMPTVIEERLIIMLEAGFHQKESLLMTKWLTQLLVRKCEGLKEEKLSIPIARSAYPLMVPDFWGILNPGEAYVGFSSFTDIDGVTDLTDSIRNGDYVLVARNPAHLPSDIQKVKVVKRDIFLPLKDVIIFSTKGNPSLASMLSGGDYDGDRAWLCWDPVIVDNVNSVSVPEFPDFFEQGILKRDTTTYNGLALSAEDRVREFLSKAIIFNMRPNLLPFCTSYKESMAFTLKSVSSKEMISISTLLSNLVDRPKQGIIFDYEDWTRYVDFCVTTTAHRTRAKIKDLVHNPNNDIIDHLRLTVGEKVDVALTKFHKKFPDLLNPGWDEDLVRRYCTARDRAASNPEWKSLMNGLVSELKTINMMWAGAFRQDSPTKGSALEDESKPDFVTIATEVFAVYVKIRPRADTPFTQALLADEPYENPAISKWELLKASTLFASYPRYRVSNCVWWMAFPQLCYIKAQSQQGQRLYLLTTRMWTGLKPDKTISRQMQSVEFTEQEADDDYLVDSEEEDD
ncbi:hypothetical protein ONS95_004613 [Cadophora gregata]|uniref:uncharacterized protein n=1 Tax=Cadophora gregata TaxID=51156 RepID=UPI0026DC7A18|nr:uncharacterized protein ONS95_004613 [Cadophora gregata]KAK0105018.1 hypothetical protein ONS96_004424 [Cadophora gregata f. sp. sojae]KAK0106109.1 hypothetical protein ONS95_004613 [Cadophora gregata]